MNRHILIIGGGLAGCTAALELAAVGQRVTILEKEDEIGGKVRKYGCKAVEQCLNCGLCLVGDLWNRVEKHENINIVTGAGLKDVQGYRGNFSVTWKSGRNSSVLDGIHEIIVAAGFEEASAESAGSLEMAGCDSVITGRRLEELLLDRAASGVFPEKPQSIAFIQCFGSRDIHEKAAYCSRVCCGYSTRMARALRKVYPEAEIVFFYMDLQRVEAGQYFHCLTEEGIRFVRCRPVKIMPGKPCAIQYEQPGTGTITRKGFDVIVLTGGIRPAKDTEQLAELCMLKVDGNGFLNYVKDGEAAGIHLAGCVRGPERIEEAHSEALAVARGILSRIADGGTI